jgi:hypothetical protein
MFEACLDDSSGPGKFSTHHMRHTISSSSPLLLLPSTGYTVFSMLVTTAAAVELVLDRPSTQHTRKPRRALFWWFEVEGGERGGANNDDDDDNGLSLSSLGCSLW